MRRLLVLLLLPLVLSACPPLASHLDGWAALIESADCTPLEANGLRVECVATTVVPLQVDLRWSTDGEPIHVETTPEGLEHRVVLSGLKPDLEYSWETRVLAEAGWDVHAGLVTTGALPEELARIERTVTTPCEGCASELVLVAWGCGTDELFVVDVAGDVVWYQELGPVQSIGATRVTDDGTILALLDRTRIVELAPTGELLLDLARGETPGFDRFVHHDLLRDGDRTLALTARDHVDGDEHAWIIDGVDVFEGGERTDRWDLLDLGVEPGPEHDQDTAYWTGRLDGQDWNHANALDVAIDGSLLLSLTGTHRVLSVADGAVADGAVDWALDGSGADGDLVLGSAVAGPADFFGQHHVRARDGGLTLYDNRNPHDGCAAAGDCDSARWIDVAVQADLGTAEVVQQWDLGLDCPTQGSATRVGDDRLLVSCAEHGLIRELDYGGNVTWELELSCGSGAPANPLYRVLPISLP
jgi:hypothetical protein